jgi:hypothetical protein
MRVAICIPSPQFVHPDFALTNLPDLVHYSRTHIKDLEIYTIYKSGVMTSSNRNWMLKQCLEEKMDAILWLDTDMLYPPNMLEKYIQSRKKIIGTVYFKRSPPYDPVVYLKGKNKFKPYQILDVTKLPPDKPFEVDGLGFGGMFVKTEVYRKMGKDKWMHYGKNFGIPEEREDSESHDLIFCKTAQKYGYKLYVHSGVYSKHIGEKQIELKDWQRTASKNPLKSKIAVIIPTTDLNMANRAMERMQEKAGTPADYYIIEDFERNGFISVMNDAVHNLPDYDFYVYAAQDAYAGEWWLKYALDAMIYKDAGLFAFNDGKWNGTLAAFGMVDKVWMKKNYKGDMFSKYYKSNYADIELTLMAIRDGKLAYNPESLLIEVDWNKHYPNQDDQLLFNKRKRQLFNSDLQELFR